MQDFDRITLRLKQQLGTTQDKDVAEALGLSAQSWSGRKKRGNFPGTELYALAAKRPELNLDVGLVLTGMPGGVVRASGAAAGSSAAQASGRAWITPPSPERIRALADLAHRISAHEFDSVYTLVESLAGLHVIARHQVESVIQSGNLPSGATQTFNAPVSGGVAGRDIVNNKRGGKR